MAVKSVDFETLIVEPHGEHIQVVTLNRPESLNAINTQLALDLRDYFGSLKKAKSLTRVVLLTGSGNKAFCAGADLKERKNMTDAQWFKQHKIFEEAGENITRCPLAVIAAVNGVAMGGGCELAMAADMIFASENAVFAQPEVRLGIIPGLGGTQRLPRLLGLNLAKELLFTGRRFSAQEAFDWGLVNKVLSESTLLAHSLQVAEEIAVNGPIAVRQVKRAIDNGFAVPIVKALKIEIEAYNKVISTKDRKEGILAFNEKRKPKFENR